MSCHAWLKTYRGTVFRWEVDHHDHLTVAYCGTRIADATVTLRIVNITLVQISGESG